MNDKLVFLEQFLGKAKYSNNTKEAEFYCCFCSHHKPKLSINLEINVWKCWVCGKAGHNLSFLLRKAGASRSEIKEFIGKHEPKSAKIQQNSEEIADFRPKLPDDFRPIMGNLDSFFGKRAFKYLTRTRKISPERILRHKIGFTTEGEFEDSIIFPSFDKKGYLNYFTARFYSGFKLGPQTPRGYKNQIIINELNIDWKKPVVITEGPIDMLKSTCNTVPLFGSTCMADSRLFRMIVSNETPVYLALDADADKKSDAIANMLMGYDVPVYGIDLGGHDDVGEMSEEDFTKAYENATILTGDDIFVKKLRAIC